MKALVTIEQVAKAAGKRGKTKPEIAARFGIGLTLASDLVNRAAEAKLVKAAKTKKPAGGLGRPPVVYVKV